MNVTAEQQVSFTMQSMDLSNANLVESTRNAQTPNVELVLGAWRHARQSPISSSRTQRLQAWSSPHHKRHHICYL